MMAQYLMSLDLGGSAAKGLLVDAATGQSFSSEKPWSNLKDAKYGVFALNLDLVAIWKALGDISKALISESGISASEIMGLAITSMRHTTIVLNGAEEILLATPNLDARALAEAANISEEHGEEIYSITGHWPSAIMAGARLKWLAEKEPSLFAEAKTFFTLADWVGFKLTGQKTAEASLAAETLLLDLKKREWSEEVLRYLSLPKHLFPPIINAGQAIGTLISDAAKHLGLKEGLLVAAGGADTQAGLLGMGIYESDKLGIVAGSTTPVVLTSNQVFIDPQRRTWASLTLIPGQYICESNAGSMGSALELFAKMLYADSHNPLFALNQDAAKLKPGETSVLSTAGAQLFNGSAVSIPLDSLTLSSMSLGSGLEGRMQVSRSILEGMAYGVLANLDQIKEVASNRPDKAFIGGGMSRSAVCLKWLQICLIYPLLFPKTLMQLLSARASVQG
ncbi:MAG: FGGY-family carbohydrate kinase [Anaerolineaceae bacterium]|nr:FGGY-family carbohydrate kinase [Anaerolineaceae bacterium]